MRIDSANRDTLEKNIQVHTCICIHICVYFKLHLMVDNVAAVVKERSPGNFHLEVNHNTVIFNDVFLERQVHRLFEENRSGSSARQKHTRVSRVERNIFRKREGKERILWKIAHFISHCNIYESTLIFLNSF